MPPKHFCSYATVIWSLKLKVYYKGIDSFLRHNRLAITFRAGHSNCLLRTRSPLRTSSGVQAFVSCKFNEIDNYFQKYVDVENNFEILRNFVILRQTPMGKSHTVGFSSLSSIQNLKLITFSKLLPWDTSNHRILHCIKFRWFYDKTCLYFYYWYIAGLI